MRCHFIRRFRRSCLFSSVLLGASLGVAPGLPAQESPASPAVRAEAQDAGTPTTPRSLYLQTLPAIALILNSDGIGTGWVLNRAERLLVTNKHVVGTDGEVKVIFPKFENGQPQVERSDYDESMAIRGVVLDSTEEADLALVQVDALPPSATEIALAPASSMAGERVHAIGGLPRGSQGMWKYSTGFVSQVSLGYATGFEIRIMQSNLDVNPGNSGGPVVNDRGELVGVCQSIHSEARDVSYNVDVEEVRKYVTKLVPLVGSDTSEALVELGQRHRQEGRTDAAMRLLTRALQKQPGMAAAKAERGWVFLAMGDRVTALRDFSDAIEADATLTAAWRGRARVHREMQKLDEAANDLSAAISCDPQSPEVYNERAIVLELAEQYELALADYQRAITMAPRSPVYLANRADLYIKIRRYRDAYPDLVKALEMNPKNAWYNNLMGDVYYGEKNFDKALEYYFTAYELDDTRLGYLTDIGEAVQSQGNHEMGVKIWTMVIERQANNGYNYYSRAWSLRRLKRLPEALDDMNVAIKLHDQSARYYKERGDILQELGRMQEAQQDLAKAARLDPERYGATAAQTTNVNVTTQNTTQRPAFSSPVIGTWYVNQPVAGFQLEATQIFGENGAYHATINITRNGRTARTVEVGTYELGTESITFRTNLGNYSAPYRFEDGLFWIKFIFDEGKFWVGSTRR